MDRKREFREVKGEVGERRKGREESPKRTSGNGRGEIVLITTMQHFSL